MITSLQQFKQFYKPENRQLFSKEEFNYIIIDEVHKAGANSYQELVNYFKPQFLLGMSATPERTDDLIFIKCLIIT